MTVRSRTLLTMAAVALMGAACDRARGEDMGSASTQTGTMGTDGAEYTLVLRSTWLKSSHPFEYPEAGAISGPHFSGVVGASHNASFSLFKEGALPTPGLERLSEEGKPSPLDDELRAAIAAGAAGALFTSGPLRDFSDSIVTTVRVDAAHPLVSLVAMIAPSPDWFAGAAAVDLRDGTSWSTERTVRLYAWDSGGDDGVTYKAPDMDNNPKRPSMPAMTRHFSVNGAAIPVATVTLTRTK